MSASNRQSPGFVVLLFVLVVLAFVPLAVLWSMRLPPAQLGLFAVFVGYFLAFHVYAPYRVHRDATRRGANATLWTVAAFFLSLVGLAAYFLVVVARGDS